jgi:hypothetical protein
MDSWPEPAEDRAAPFSWRITLDGIAHAYGGKPRSEQDYALKPLRHVWEQGMAYAMLGPSGRGQDDVAQHHFRACHSVEGASAV